MPLRNRLKSARTWLSMIGPRRRIRTVPKSAGIRVFYGHSHVPGSGEHARGGIVKFQHLLPYYPNSPDHFNILCMVSSAPPEGAHLLAKTAQKKGAKLIWNQNGVACPATQPDWQMRNRPMAKLFHAADHVFYQSEFCRLCAHRFLGPRSGPGEILYNAVDTTAFTPAELAPDPLVLLLGGTQYQHYRFETAVRTLALVRRTCPDAHLIVTGALCWHPDPAESLRQAHALIQELHLTESVELAGPYTQRDAPGIFRRAHILLHTKYNDPCPGLVVEALASGLPVVYSHSGGVPELVGPDAGIGIPAECTWERDLPPSPEALAAAVLQIAENRQPYAQAARQRAVEHFDVCHWVQRYRDIFEAIL